MRPLDLVLLRVAEAAADPEGHFDASASGVGGEHLRYPRLPHPGVRTAQHQGADESFLRRYETSRDVTLDQGVLRRPGESVT